MQEMIFWFLGENNTVKKKRNNSFKYIYIYTQNINGWNTLLFCLFHVLKVIKEFFSLDYSEKCIASHNATSEITFYHEAKDMPYVF